MPETNVGLSYELAGVADLNGDKHLVSEISTCQLQMGRPVGGGASVADDRPPVSVLVRG
jgi:hypothetical protein